MQLHLLGPVEAGVNGRMLPLGGAKQRSVLAMLALEANRTVSADHLVEGLWGEHPPPSAAKMVQNYVWRLRTALGEDSGVEIATRGRGYELRIDEDAVDARRFERLLAEAVRAAREGAASEAAREALALWRGRALDDVADEPFAAAEIRRLEALRVEAAELAIAADLAAGRHHEVVGEIDALLADHPLREPLHAHRMLALYRCGRQADALEAYREARRTLVEEMGLEPGPELRRLHEAILRQDPALDVEPATSELPRELDSTGAPPLVGRDRELARLRSRWRDAAAGAGGLVTLAGLYGIGKTRLAMEIAADAHRDGATVLYAAGRGTPERALAVLDAARAARRPMLAVLDDVDRATGAVQAKLRDAAPALAGAPVLLLVTASDVAALAGVEPEEALALAPLDVDAVGMIAGLYAPVGEADVPLQALAATSGGVPRRVHEAAGEWARGEATRRVNAAAARAASGRTEARSLVADLAGRVAELQTARERSELAQERGAASTVACPYKGLASFQPDDAEYFFGRERLIAAIVARLVGENLLAVVGPSGSGKSSVLRAGLLPALASGVLPASEHWSQVLLRPGEHPMRELRDAAGQLGRRRLVIAVDQFEEVFTACRDEEERVAFVSALVRAAGEQGGQAVVVLAIRADFYGRCAEYPQLARLLAANQVLVGPMSRDELRRAIASPAERVGLLVEPELVDALVADVEGQPGALPLLSTALLELWQRRRGRRLTLSAYEGTGGVRGAVARLAEQAYLALEPDDRALTRQVMLRLTGDGEGGGVVRRRVQLAELEHARELVHHLADRRLLTVSQGTVEVAHEALLREWPRLRSWLEEDVQGRRLLRQISDAAREWEDEGRDPAALYRGARLSAALEWRAAHDDELNERERAFLDAARVAGQRAHRRLQLVLAGVGALLVVAVLAGIVALEQRGNARAEALSAQAQRLGAQALTADALDRSLLLARQAVALEDSAATRSNLLSALVRSPAAVKILRGEGGRMLSVGAHPDGRTIAAGDNRGRLLAFDVATGRRLGVRYRTGLPIHAVRFSPDGARLVLASANQGGGTALDVLDGGTFRRVAHHRLPPMGTLFGSIAFAPDSRTFVTAYEPFTPQPPYHGLLRRWSSADGRPLASRRVPNGASLSVTVTADGRLVTISEWADETVIRDQRTLEPIRRVSRGGLPWASTVTQDGRLAALGRDDGSVLLVDLRTGRSREAAGRHDVSVQGAAFTPDGRWLLTSGDDARLRVRPVEGPARVETFEGHTGRIAGLALSPDGRTAYTASLDGTVIVWDLAGERRFGRVFSPDPPGRATIPDESLRESEEVGYNFGSASDGDLFAIARPGGDVHLVDARTLSFVRRIHAVDGAGVVGVEFAPDGRTLAVTGQDGSVRLWDARSGRPVSDRLVATPGQWEWSPSFSADGRWLATGGLDGGVRLWDVRRHSKVGELRYDGMAPGDVTLRPDGKVLIVPVTSGPGSGFVEVLAVPSLKRLRRIDMTWGRVSRFSADGRLLALGDNEGRAQIYDGRTFTPRGKPLVGHAGAVVTADFSPRGELLATSSTDGTVRLWDTATGRPVGAPLPGLANVALGAAFVRGGTHVAAVHDGGRGYLWDVRPSSWSRHACEVAGRPLTRLEWEEALPTREYAAACVGGG
jgi:WD40 repeat protein/DNA-binding SARP family transcriptional activator